MRHGLILVVLAAGTLSVLGGCDDSPKEILVDGNTVLFYDGLTGDVTMVRQVADTISGGLTRIRTQFKNRDDDSVWMDIQVVWKDKDDMELYKTSWQSFHIPAKSVEQYEIVSLRPVDHYEFRIRKPDTKGKK